MGGTVLLEFNTPERCFNLTVNTEICIGPLDSSVFSSNMPALDGKLKHYSETATVDVY